MDLNWVQFLSHPPPSTFTTCVLSTSHTFHIMCTFTQGGSYTCEHVNTHTHMRTHRMSNVFSNLCAFRLEPLNPGQQAWLLSWSREGRGRGHDTFESCIALWDRLPSWEALGITPASVQTLWEASFPLKLTSWDSISAILFPMWAGAQTGGPVTEATLSSLPPFPAMGSFRRGVPPSQGPQGATWHLTTAAQTHTAEGKRPGHGPPGA